MSCCVLSSPPGNFCINLSASLDQNLISTVITCSNIHSALRLTTQGIRIRFLLSSTFAMYCSLSFRSLRRKSSLDKRSFWHLISRFRSPGFLRPKTVPPVVWRVSGSWGASPGCLGEQGSVQAPYKSRFHWLSHDFEEYVALSCALVTWSTNLSLLACPESTEDALGNWLWLDVQYPCIYRLIADYYNRSNHLWGRHESLGHCEFTFWETQKKDVVLDEVSKHAPQHAPQLSVWPTLKLQIYLRNCQLKTRSEAWFLLS